MHARRRFTARELDEQVRTLRVLAVLAIGVVLMIAAAWLAGFEVRSPDVKTNPSSQRPIDPVRAELFRCNSLGEAALDDPACRAAWAENRRRFFGPGERRSGGSPQETRP